MSSGVGERLVAARAEVDRVCQLLLSPSPDVLDRCAGMLETAICEISATPDCAPEPAARETFERQAQSLAVSLARARLLLNSALEFHHNWLRRLGEISGGYTGTGEPATIAGRGHLAIQG